MLYKTVKLFQALELEYPNPRIELHYSNKFELLVSIMLSARTTDKAVNRVTRSLFALAPDPQSMIVLGVEGVYKCIQSIGLAQNKARYAVTLSKQLVAKYNAEPPLNLQELMSLPGVGRKTAQVFLNSSISTSYISVDTHVSRVASRLGIVQSTHPTKVELEIVHSVPREHHFLLSNRLVLHGRYICKARKPICNLCPLKKWCPFYKKNYVSL